MSLTIELLPAQEQQIQAEAERAGVSVSEIVKRALDARFPVVGGAANRETLELFAQWEQEDAIMSNEERAENERIYTEIERNGIARVQI